jgi:hypothetical protein
MGDVSIRVGSADEYVRLTEVEFRMEHYIPKPSKDDG